MHGQKGQNYFLAHWNGDLSLARSYWLNGVFIGNVLLTTILLNLSQFAERTLISLRGLSALTLASVIVATLVWLWAIVGVWRSASKHRARGGSGLVAVLVQCTSLLNVLFMANNFFTAQLPQMREFYAIATGHDRMTAIEIKTDPKGESLYLTGLLGEGSHARFVDALNSAPLARQVVLNSPGGRLLEAEYIARLLKEKRLDTYVEGECSSACTYIFLAGKERVLTPNARLGFHQPSFPGVNGAEQQIATNRMLDKYRQAGLPTEALQKISVTRADSMWYPSHTEMLAAHMVTRMSLGDDASIWSATAGDSREAIRRDLLAAPVWRAYEQRSPGKIEEVADLLWKLKLQGASDTVVQVSVRNAVAAIHSQALKNAEDIYLDQYANLFYDELLAARAINAAACARLIKGELDVRKSLRADLAQRDTSLMEHMLTAPPRKVFYTMQSPEFQRSMEKLKPGISPLYRRVTTNIRAYANQPELQCDAILALYKNILRLQNKDRHIIMNAMMLAR